MDLQIELFTTPIVEGRKILSSKGLVCANVVLDAGVIYDAYKEKSGLPDYIDKEGLEPYHQELFEALEKETLEKGANAVVDLHIEHSYVHRGDYYYLLISAHGTAVVIEGVAEKPTKSNINGKVLEQQVFHKHILTKLKEWYDEYERRTKAGEYVQNWKCSISDEEWVFVCRYPDISYAEYMHLAYTEGILNDYIVKYSRFFKYFKKLPYEKQIELAYKYCNQQSSKLIVECNLFDAKQILSWAQKGELGFAADCLKAQKKEYSAQDLEDMQKLHEFFVNLPEEKLKDKQEEIVKEFGIKIEALKELLSNIGK